MITRIAAVSGSLTIAALLTATVPTAATPPDVASEPVVRYDGQCVVRAWTTSPDELQTVLDLTPDVWSHHIDVGPIDVRISADDRAALDRAGIRYHTLIEDVQLRIDRERQTAGSEPIQDGSWFDDFKTYDQITTYLNDLADLRPDIATVIEIGTTIENRTIYGLRITNAPVGPATPGIMFNGCQHAREWVASMATTYIADQLVRQYESDPDITDLVDSTVFYVVPVVNPDGFVYTWTTQRLWRKNRRNNGNNTFGIDLNRNWSYEWGGVGSSGNPGSDLYRGPAPFSEPETAAVRDFLLDRPWIIRHVDIHSYGQYVLYPWAFTTALTIEGAAFPNFAGQIANAITSVHGTAYQPGQWYSRLYPSSGVMQDYVYAERAAWSFTYELRDTGRFGFILPADQIIPTAEEIFAGALELTTADFETRMLLESTDLTRGDSATLRAHRGQPGSRTYFVYTFDGYGSTPVPALNITLNLNQPVLVGSAQADADGLATLTRTIPNNAPPTDILLQAAQRNKRSSVVERTIN